MTMLLFFLSGCSDMRPTNFDFKTFERSAKPNSYLICPAHYCAAHIDAIAPVYPVSVTALMKAWQKMIDAQPRILVIYHDDHDYQYVQRSLIFRFPDKIYVRFIPLENDMSTLAIYSHSVYGYYDIGVNKKRIESWLAQLAPILNSK